MFALMPWTRRELRREFERPLGWMTEEFEPLMTRMFNWPMMEMAERPYPWGLTTEEKEKEFVIRVELPGFAPEEVNVEVLANRLTITAEHPLPTEGTEEKREVEHRRVRRIVTLPEGVEPERIEATYRNGVLEVHLPRIPEAIPRKIEVKT